MKLCSKKRARFQVPRIGFPVRCRGPRVVCPTVAPSHASGVAAVEFAVCLPVILLLLFGMIESCTMIFLKQSLTIAAYEGSRQAIVQGATTDNVAASCTSILASRKVHDAVIQINPPNIETARPGDPVEVRVSAPSNSNSVMRGWFFTDKVLEAKVTMMKEY